MNNRDPRVYTVDPKVEALVEALARFAPDPDQVELIFAALNLESPFARAQESRAPEQFSLEDVRRVFREELSKIVAIRMIEPSSAGSKSS